MKVTQYLSNYIITEYINQKNIQFVFKDLQNDYLNNVNFLVVIFIIKILKDKKVMSIFESNNECKYNIQFLVESTVLLQKENIFIYKYIDSNNVERLSFNKPICIHWNKNHNRFDILYNNAIVGTYLNNFDNNYCSFRNLSILIIEEMLYEFYRKFSNLDNNKIINETKKITNGYAFSNSLPLIINEVSVINYNKITEFIKTPKINSRTINYKSFNIALNENYKKVIQNILQESNYNLNTYDSGESLKILYDLISHLNIIIRKIIKQFNEKSIIVKLYKELEYIEKIHWDDRNSLDKLVGANEKIEKDLKNRNDSVPIKNTLQYLLELSVNKGNFDLKKPISEKAFVFLFNLAYCNIRYIFILENSCYMKNGTTISIEDNYKIKINEGNLYNYENYSRKVSYNNSIHHKNFDSDIYKKIGSLNESFKNGYEFTAEEFINVINFLCIYPINEFSEYPLVYIDKELLISIIKNNLPINKYKINKIINYITISKTDDYLPKIINNDENRFSLNPIINCKDITNKDKIIYGIYSLFEAKKYYLMAISKGSFNFTFKKNENTNEIEKKFKTIKKSQDKKLEIDIIHIANDIFGEQYVFGNFEKMKIFDNTLTSNKISCGDIDCLIVDKKNKIVHVIEAKNVLKHIPPKKAFNNVNKFLYNKKNYFQKIITKKEFIEKQLEVILNHYNITGTENWKVIPLLVSNPVYYSPFKKNNKIRYKLLNELEEYLRNPNNL